MVEPEVEKKIVLEVIKGAYLFEGIEKGTIHTKRHSGEDPSKMSIAKSDSATNVFSDFNMARPDKQRNQDDLVNSLEEVKIFLCFLLSSTTYHFRLSVRKTLCYVIK